MNVLIILSIPNKDGKNIRYKANTKRILEKV